MFILDFIDDDGCKVYFSTNHKYSVIERPDEVFLTYKFNEKDNCYDWLEDKSYSLKECEEIVKRR